MRFRHALPGLASPVLVTAFASSGWRTQGQIISGGAGRLESGYCAAGAIGVAGAGTLAGDGYVLNGGALPGLMPSPVALPEPTPTPIPLPVPTGARIVHLPLILR